MNLNKLRTIMELASAELNDIANADQDKRMCAHARLGDALEAARRIGLPPGVEWCPARDGVDSLVWCAEKWREAATAAMDNASDAKEWKERYLEARRKLDIARGLASADRAGVAPVSP